MSDLISRHDAITLPVMPKEHREYQTYNLDDAYEQGWFDLQKCIEKLPSVQPEVLAHGEGELSAQPEVIRCGECKHKPYPSDNYDFNNGDCGFEIIFPDYRCPCQCDDGYYNRIPDDDWFCGNAERRTNG